MCVCVCVCVCDRDDYCDYSSGAPLLFTTFFLLLLLEKYSFVLLYQCSVGKFLLVISNPEISTAVFMCL